MFTSKIDKLVYVVGIYTITSFTLKVVKKTAVKVTKELENSRNKEEAKSPRDTIDILLDVLSDEEKAELDSKLVELWKSINNDDFDKKTED